MGMGGVSPAQTTKGPELSRPKMNLVHFYLYRTVQLWWQGNQIMFISNYSGTNKRIHMNQLKSTYEAS